ncbi:MAG: sn-glycerol-3-phosphate ABC transporter ATP-binding protein UgpC [Leuconostoc pseudomesenteroides]|uniref:ABC transporter ATP-binding protein n=1 Tax=Leuconostoc TaxID=1243 RepID=UPI001124340C|nr:MULTISPECIES: sn-glycerol-3-phosphate ABC transporter ATP-binding protein UgpC [Leuconostoc]MCT4388081.1 sn-glycerol-3-phosphate ABC transporter ATP-binding protein UgpC [Leuconostoc pseudomesenteroides]MCT4412949.1 sn-glycerol-3-phosphate ABC transporter ATP-binding protein UgpC [Leuconostoc pseudomesenteroides]MDI6552208.1 sn-glycerol-3-phosphate ABC transporter ATP-binding protein UgpC [Leuconostoc falkenbergense]MDI6666139.1 sn-glycerol-3-phosphate ABC transporter ATP-binding protein Ugp
MVELNLEHIYKKYDNGDNYSVTDFSLDIKDKEFVVFVGPSGCGKSTTIRMIAGLEDITEGKLLIDGKVVNNELPKDRDIAMVFQNYALYPHMSVYDNMSFGLKLRKYSKEDISERVHNAARVIGLEEFLNRKPADLSGGQRQRVALGRAIVRDAPIFLMDEPLSNLDAKLRVSMRAEIAKLHRRLQTTTIYVTHDQTEAMTMADRIVIMKDGKIQQVGTPQEVYDNPANLFVGSFIGSPAMNFFNVTLKNNRIVEANNDFSLEVPEGCLKVLNSNGYSGKKLKLGIRPEDIHTENTFIQVFPNATIDTTVNVSELLGAESQLYCKFGDQEIIAKVNSRDHINAGAQLTIGLDLNKAHFFDPETEITVY